MFRLPIQIAARFAIYAGVTSLTQDALTESFDMETETARVPAQATGVAASFVLGRYTDVVVDRVASKIQACRNKSVAE